jgi:hypothetical protein
MTHPIPAEAVTAAEPHPEGNPALAAAAEAILDRHLAAYRASGTGEARRAAILVDALPDAAAAIQGAAPVLAAPYAARIAELTALAAEILGSYSKAEGGYRGRVGQMQIVKWRERLDGTT